LTGKHSHRAFQVEGAATRTVSARNSEGWTGDKMQEVGKEQVMGCLIFHADVDGLYPVSDRSHQKVLTECKLNYKSTLKHRGHSETERPEVRSRGSAAKPR